MGQGWEGFKGVGRTKEATRNDEVHDWEVIGLSAPWFTSRVNEMEET